MDSLHYRSPHKLSYKIFINMKNYNMNQNMNQNKSLYKYIGKYLNMLYNIRLYNCQYKTCSYLNIHKSTIYIQLLLH